MMIGPKKMMKELSLSINLNKMAVLAVHQLYASKYLKELCDIGVLSEISLGRDKLFIHPKLMSLLRGENN